MKRTRKPSAFSVLEAALSIATALLVAWGMGVCVRLFCGAPQPVSRETVTQTIHGLAVPFALWVALLTVCAVGRVLWPQDAHKQEAPPSPPNAAQAPTRPVARVLLYAAAFALLALGVSNGGMRDVLAKAIKICTECIGLG